MANEMANEENRLKTFDLKWKHRTISSIEMAKNGFYYIGPEDEVRCYYCRVKLDTWEYTDNVTKTHYHCSPGCPKMVELRAGDIAKTPRMRKFGNQTHSIFLNTLKKKGIVRNDVWIHTEISQFPEYVSKNLRLISFENWPKGMNQKPEAMSDAGFFYTQVGDRVICHSCGGGLRDWEYDDDPWTQHILWFNDCKYIKTKKSAHEIGKIVSKYFEKTNNPIPEFFISPETDELFETPQDPVKQWIECEKLRKTAKKKLFQYNGENKQLTKTCKDFCSKDHKIVFSPCGHSVTCVKCAFATVYCPICMRPYQNVIINDQFSLTPGHFMK